MKAIVVGASTGLGRAIGIGLAKRGATVALLARNRERLATAAAAAGSGAFGVACDVVDEVSCREAVVAAVDGLGGLDALVYAPGVGPLVRLTDLDAATWRHTFDVNVVGAALMTGAALPHLAASGGVAAYLSSVTASYTPPWPGLAAYAVSKAALDKLVEAWRVEHPEVGFTRVVLGNCAGGEGDERSHFNVGWDPTVAAEIVPRWHALGYVGGELVDLEVLVGLLDTVLRTGATASIPSVTLAPRPFALTRRGRSVYFGGKRKPPSRRMFSPFR